MPPSESRVLFTNRLSEPNAANNRILENGSGVALGDFDGDGLCDIYLCRLEGPNALYRNLGDWKFEEVAKKAGVDCQGQISTGAALADIDGNANLDLLVNSLGGGTRSFRNVGGGRFEEIRETRLARQLGATSMALADVDGDGDLDLYVANYRTTTFKDRPPGLNVEAKMVDGKVVVTPADRFISLGVKAGGVELLEKGDRDFLYINDGNGGFSPVSWTQGSFLDEEGAPLKAPPTDWGLAVMFRDINGDHLPDIYVCNDFYHWPDRVWMNEEGKRFRAIKRTSLRNMSLSSMAVDFADINRDGFDDFFVVDMMSRHHPMRQRQRENALKKEMLVPILDANYRVPTPRNTLCLNRGDATFAEVAQLSGVEATEWSWGAIFLDVDLDGYEDLLVATGNSHDVQDRDTLQSLSVLRQAETAENRLANWRRFPRLESPRLAFRNQRDLTFADSGDQWGFNQVGIAHGMAAADFDNDGDLDLVVNDLNQNASLYRNETTSARVQVRLNGAAKNRFGIGSRIEVHQGAVPIQSQEMIAGGRYLSGDQALRVFAAGSETNILRIKVAWRSGKQSVVENARANRIYEINEDKAGEPPPALAKPPPLFIEAANALVHLSDTRGCEDQQVLLPRTQCRSGPGLSWADLNGDGWDDLVVGSSPLAVFHNDQKGRFIAWTNPPMVAEKSAEFSGVLAYSPGSGPKTILLSESSHTISSNTQSKIHPLSLKPKSGAPLRVDNSRAGPIVLGDVDGDGDLDLFVGGGSLPGRYPVATSSHLYRWEVNGFELDAAHEKVFQAIGLVKGAVFSDLNGDGRVDLVLACEWGPVRIFQNEHGKLREITRESGLSDYVGLWNGVTTADLDGDGRMDIVAANWGRNTRYQRYLKKPIQAFHGDYDRNGTREFFEVYHDPELKKLVPWITLDLLQEISPSLAQKFSTFRDFSLAGIEDILKGSPGSTQHLEFNTLESAIFLNRGKRFEHHPLPIEAQFAPAFGIAAADFDGDGNEDLFLCQNFFGVDLETSRYDAGQGLYLKGNGRAEFSSQPSSQSGIALYGEQRAVGVSDYDQDGRPDLAVTQHGGPTRIFRNTQGKQGLRVQLLGSDTVPAVGASMRIAFANGQFGPLREIHLGGGYRSQNSATEVLATPAEPRKLWVRWPGGKVTLSDIPNGARNVTVTGDGSLKVVRP